MKKSSLILRILITTILSSFKVSSAMADALFNTDKSDNRIIQAKPILIKNKSYDVEYNISKHVTNIPSTEFAAKQLSEIKCAINALLVDPRDDVLPGLKVDELIKEIKISIYNGYYHADNSDKREKGRAIKLGKVYSQKPSGFEYKCTTDRDDFYICPLNYFNKIVSDIPDYGNYIKISIEEDKIKNKTPLSCEYIYSKVFDAISFWRTVYDKSVVDHNSQGAKSRQKSAEDVNRDESIKALGIESETTRQ